MFTPQEKAERRERALAELAERGLALACDLQEAALAATDLDEKARMASAFGKVSRAVRQAFWLDAKLDAELARQQEAADAAAAEAGRKRHAERKTQVRQALERAIDEGFDDEDAEFLLAELDIAIDQMAERPGFDDEPVEAIIARVCDSYGIAPPGAHGSSPFSPSGEMSRSDRGGRAAGPVGEHLESAQPDFDAAPPYQSSA